MNEKLDLTVILKDCPKGMELDSKLFNGVVTFNGIINDEQYPIEIKIDDKYKEFLDKHGRFIDRQYYNCAIFPKGKTTWEGFQRPFVDGDIVATNNGHFIGIFKVKNNVSFETYCAINDIGSLTINTSYYSGRFATEEEKQKLFQAIKDNGYKWNAETKTLEKLIIPKFEIGNNIQSKTDNNDKFTITDIDLDNRCYYGRGKGHEFMIPIVKQDNWELIPYKFDPKSLKPFDKVLVRTYSDNIWSATFFSHLNHPATFYHKFATTSGLSYKYMIPYNEETKHLLGTNEQAPEFYNY